MNRSSRWKGKDENNRRKEEEQKISSQTYDEIKKGNIYTTCKSLKKMRNRMAFTESEYNILDRRY